MAPTRGHAGFTLVETVVSIVVLAIALSTLAFMMGAGVADSADTYDETLTAALAQAYLDEILARRFDERSHPSGTPPCSGLAGEDPEPERPCSTTFSADGGEAGRALFDDVDDYHGIDEGDGGTTGPDLLDAEGLVRDGYENFRIAIEVIYAGDQAPINKSLTDAKRVTVTVYHPTRPGGVHFSAYKANF